jgi:hypothetical protein
MHPDPYRGDGGRRDRLTLPPGYEIGTESVTQAFSAQLQLIIRGAVGYKSRPQFSGWVGLYRSPILGNHGNREQEIL